mmetsp:Transcript_9395/g.13907  ORF Transcript_9395/g.13907 Transcript_9395/m.13907 type:complete len:489 (-) Transcript_9395:59-1525(-)
MISLTLSLYVILIILLIHMVTESQQMGCMHKGKRVSWWFMYAHPDPKGEEGKLAYTVLSSVYKEETPTSKMYDSAAPLGETVDQLDMSVDGRDENEHFIVYNDQLNDDTSNIKLKDFLDHAEAGEIKENFFKREGNTLKLTKEGKDFFANEANAKWWGHDIFKPDSSGNSGHEKGIMGYNKQGGFWLIHSLPNFPVPNDQDVYAAGMKRGKLAKEFISIHKSGKREFLPKNAGSNGQHFFCMSFDDKDAQRVLGQISLYRPRILSSRLTEEQEALVAKTTRNSARDIFFDKTIDRCDTIKGAENKPDKNLCNEGQINHQTLHENSMTFEMFGKNVQYLKMPSSYGKYFDTWLYVRSRLFKDGKVQTWQSGKPSQKVVDQSHLKNIKTIEINRHDIWSYGKDHSKYAVGTGDWACAGGLNRGDNEHHRYGGIVCLQNARLSDFLNRIGRIDIQTNTKKALADALDIKPFPTKKELLEMPLREALIYLSQ